MNGQIIWVKSKLPRKKKKKFILANSRPSYFSFIQGDIKTKMKRFVKPNQIVAFKIKVGSTYRFLTICNSI